MLHDYKMVWMFYKLVSSSQTTARGRSTQRVTAAQEERQCIRSDPFHSIFVWFYAVHLCELLDNNICGTWNEWKTENGRNLTCPNISSKWSLLCGCRHALRHMQCACTICMCGPGSRGSLCPGPGVLIHKQKQPAAEAVRRVGAPA